MSQYYIHRFLLHGKGLLAPAHRAWQHSVSAPWSAVAHYDHPLAYVLGRALPCYLPAVLFRFHLLTWFLFVAVVSVEEVTTFSGYSAVYSMLGGATRRTDLHFETCGEVRWPRLPDGGGSTADSGAGKLRSVGSAGLDSRHHRWQRPPGRCRGRAGAPAAEGGAEGAAAKQAAREEARLGWRGVVYVAALEVVVALPFCVSMFLFFLDMTRTMSFAVHSIYYAPPEIRMEKEERQTHR